MKLYHDLFKSPCPEFKAFTARDAQAQEWRKHADAQAAYLSKAESEFRAAVETYQSDPALKNFTALVEAKTRFKAAEEANREYYGAITGYTDRYTATDEARETMLGALTVARDRLAKKIKELNETEAERLAAAGVEAEGEHPGITALKEHLKKLADAICDCRDNRASVHPWKKYRQLIHL